MWGFGGKYYWGRREKGRKSQGVVVIFAWMSSEQRHLKHYIDLYASSGWNSFVCHSQFLNSFFPEKAELLALEILDELVEELRINPVPVIFASFSGGPKACMYKLLQVHISCWFSLELRCESDSKILNDEVHMLVMVLERVPVINVGVLIIQGMYEKQRENMDNYRIVRDCVSGHIYDSSPVDFTSDLGTRFVLHPSVLGISNPPRFAQWIAKGIASSLDGLFLSRFETQRAEYWQILYASVSFGAPYLIMCSEDDDLAPCQTICNFAQRLQELGADVRLVKWTSSPHVGHYREHPIDYKGAVTELLQKASTLYLQRTNKRGGEKMGLEGSHDEISEPLGDLRKAAASSNDILKRFSIGMGGPSLVPSSFEYHEGKAVGSIQDEPKSGLIHLPNPPGINANGVLGQVLFDVCIPQNIEEWDVGQSSSSIIRSPFPSTRRHGMHFNPIKCIRRSRL
ncbi:hypothetical protein Cgig2_012984 [Carnegiea gigantea]|uniref:DUF829 domain-containing protein n=1 Tax=Carnegiea gigantea TaxID=171969 RepID=A0A9Q1QE54_9CARY|nr:hypothetical protein Cgig2_012984 [Carnegiea gigantea]